MPPDVNGKRNPVPRRRQPERVGRGEWVLIVGGNSNNGSSSGVGYSNSNNAWSISNANIGARHTNDKNIKRSPSLDPALILNYAEMSENKIAERLCLATEQAVRVTQIESSGQVIIASNVTIMNSSMDRYFDLRTKVSEIPWEELSYEEIDLILAKRIEAFKARPSPKREGYVIERMAEINNLWSADAEAQDKGKEKRNAHIRRHNEQQAEDLRKLQLMILTLEFPERHFHPRMIKGDAGKVREIIIQDYFPWRIIPHAMMNVIGDRLYKRLIYDTCACIKGKGLHFGVRRMKMFLRRYDFTHYWQADFKKFYQSVPHELIIGEIRKMYKDEQFMKFVEMTVCFYESDIEELLRDEERKRRSHRGL
jgi:hypothetical protein